MNYLCFLEKMKTIDEKIWFTPISENKWSISEIISHILFWDLHLINNVIPSVLEEKGLTFPEFNTQNLLASSYAKSGVTKEELLNEAIFNRNAYVKAISGIPLSKLEKNLTYNNSIFMSDGKTLCSFKEIVSVFENHDTHHMKQINNFLNKKKS